MVAIMVGGTTVRLLTVSLAALLALGAAPAAAAAEYSYSLREAIQSRDVRSATLQPAKGEVDVTLRDSRRVTVDYAPTDQDLAEDLRMSGSSRNFDGGLRG